MSKKYRIQLKPIDKFFFGTDMTFQIGPDENDEYNSKYSSYIIESAFFPQQTSLLGMLRFLILRRNKDCFIDDSIIKGKEKEVENLIGPKSFMVNPNHERSDFGQILNLSACHISYKGKRLQFAPITGGIIPQWDEDWKGSFCGMNVDIPILKGFSAKEGLTQRLSNGTSIANIFLKDRRIGINRDIATGLTDNNSLFKQISYRFAENDYAFDFDLEVKDDCLLDNLHDIVYLGADNSRFELNVTTAVNQSSKDNDSLSVVLQSPAYLQKEDVALSRFCATQLMPFRFMLSRVSDSIDYRKLRTCRSDKKYMLYAPGSVFFFKDKDNRNSFVSALEKYMDFRQVGYNEI